MINTTPTKANLIKSKSLLNFSEKGYDLLDKKRSVLVKEIMGLIDKVKDVEKRISITFEEAYKALKLVNVTMGVNNVEETAMSIPKIEEYEILLKSIMGVEIPTVKFEEKVLKPYYGFFRTNPAMDIAVMKFREVKYLIYELSEIENSVYKLAMEIKKTQKRANALEKIQIPKYKHQVKFISEALEEKEREDFFRLKKVKKKM
ncbi:V-type ATP synthase subunit D [Maledivibacter halophilus]|uniref:V-type ATP synthase subunit D n=1 Tax=Maledivibacter halophilus TaxID=36842 RepID=A0A1T5JZD4_9FIRM|nr:V-type ATP synthase subunit D [Maledivibacter halophilus]SKC56690.1 V/A-type H+-transporting ATPase subunit D [Maledivibacter halophilus]